MQAPFFIKGNCIERLKPVGIIEIIHPVILGMTAYC
jgi:hypothetical protein